MDPVEQSLRNQIAAMTRVLAMAKIFRQDNYPITIEENLFLGSAAAANNKSALKDLNITHILNVTNSLEPSHPNDFVYKVIKVADREDTNLRQYFEECFEFIDEGKRAGGCVLVHCFAGISRSVTVVVAYLMRKYRMTVSQALEYVRSRRSKASPNAGFIRQLQEFEKSLHGQEEEKTTEST
ncbi:hypothetical protein UlMin_009377 [Ulmus minor]